MGYQTPVKDYKENLNKFRPGKRSYSIKPVEVVGINSESKESTPLISSSSV